MFDILKSATKAAIGIVTLPIDVIADVVTMGGLLTEKNRPYTADKAIKIMKNIKDVVEP